MAGDWIKMEKGLPDKPEVRRLSRALGMSRYDVVGRLHAVWSWADTHSFSGSNMDISEEDIDDIADFDGFAAALRQVGWLRGRAAALEFPNFGRHNGQTAKSRALEALKKQNQRAYQKYLEEYLAKYGGMPYDDAGQERDICPDDDGTRPGPEKRREEFTRKKGEGEESAGSGYAAGDPPPPPDSSCSAARSDGPDEVKRKRVFMRLVCSVRDGWAGKLTKAEAALMPDAYRNEADAWTERTAEIVRDYLATAPANASKWDFPDDRELFLRKLTPVRQKAEQWAKRTRWKSRSQREAAQAKKASGAAPVAPVSDEDHAASLAAFHKMMKEEGFLNEEEGK